MQGTSNTSCSDLMTLLQRDTRLKRVATTNGGEYAGPCPFCGGTDRFRVWPRHPSGTARWECMGYEVGRAGCGKTGDAIAYLVERGDITPAQAGKLRHDGSWTSLSVTASRARSIQPSKPLSPPSQKWQQTARSFVTYAQEQLWKNGTALDWLDGRGLSRITIKVAGLGWNPQDLRRDPAKWDLAEGKPVWLPKGWVIPWEIDGQIWRVNIRRPEGEPKYIGPRGSSNALFNSDALATANPAIMVEGEIDALTLNQAAGDLITPVATGSTSGARRTRWITKLALCPLILVSFDAELDKGDKAADWWVNVLSNAKRWRPYWGDANAMAQDGADIRSWVLAGIGEHVSANAQGMVTVDGQSRSDLEAKAAEILRKNPTEPEAQLAWCRRYAALMARMGIPSTDYPSWGAWLADMEAALVP